MGTRTILGLALAVAGCVLIPAAELRAAETRGLKLTRPMVLEGIYLRAAVYDVRWEMQDTHVIVTFSRKGRTVATVQGELKTIDRTATNDTLYFTRHSDGFFYINTLGLAKTNKGIIFPVLRSRSAAAQSNPAGSALMENDWVNRSPNVPRVYR